MAKNGNTIIVYWKVNNAWTAIAATKSNEINVACETIEISDTSQGVWRKFIAGRKEWSLTVNFLVMNVGSGDASVQDVIKVGTEYELQFATNDANHTGGVTGSAILTQAKITATRGNLATGSFVFKGISALTT
jgi:predicted secreted protein